MRKKLNRLLAHIDMAQGTPFSRFNNPDYDPVDSDIEEAIERISGLINIMAQLSVATARLDKEADWLAQKWVDNDCPDELPCPNGTGISSETCVCCWREAARKAVAQPESAR